MAGGIAGLVSIGMIGGSPIMKVRQVIGEFLPLTKSLDGGPGLQPLMQRVMSGGMASILPNPMQAVAGQLQGAISQGVDALANVSGAAGLISALTGAGGLAASAAGLVSAGSAMLTGQGVLNMVAHGTMAEMAGAALPDALGVDLMLGPLTAGGPLAEAADAVPAIIADVLAGRLDATAAALVVQGHAVGLDRIVQASADAVAGMGARAWDIAAVSTTVAACVSAPDPVRAVLLSALVPDARDAVVASLETHVAEDPEVLERLRLELRRVDLLPPA